MRARLKMHQKVLIALVALITMGLLLAVGVWAYDDAQKDQIAPGVKVGGVDVGGRDADSARKIIEQKVVAPLKQPVVVSYDGKDYSLSPKQLHEKADVDGMVQEAIDRSRQGNILDRVSRYATGGDVNADIAPDVGYSKKAVDDFVNQLAAQINVDPVNASVIPTGGGWLHLAIMLDLYSRRVVGWAMGNERSQGLSLKALRMAIEQRRPGKGLLHHSDQGSAYVAGLSGSRRGVWGFAPRRGVSSSRESMSRS